MVEAQKPAKSFSALDSARRRASVGAGVGERDDVPNALMTPFVLMMCDVVVERAAQRIVTEEDQAIQALVLD